MRDDIRHLEPNARYCRVACVCVGAECLPIMLSDCRQGRSFHQLTSSVCPTVENISMTATTDMWQVCRLEHLSTGSSLRAKDR
jgi:hypothetical protein